MTARGGPGRLRPKRSLGQNFLVDANVQRKIVDALHVRTGDEVLEIGPGTGALTRHLCGAPRRLVLVELDDHLAEALALEYGGRPDVEVLHANILDVNLGSVTARVADLKIIGNIPYNLTTPILFKLLERPRPLEMVLMVQREVGERMLAAPGSGTYGALTVGIRTVADVELILKVPRGAFRPLPRVDSSVVRIRPHVPERLTEVEEQELRKLTRAAFSWRRKQMQTTLRKHASYGLSEGDVRRLESRTGLPLWRRPEAFSPEEFVTMSRLLPAGGT